MEKRFEKRFNELLAVVSPSSPSTPVFSSVGSPPNSPSKSPVIIDLSVESSDESSDDDSSSNEEGYDNDHSSPSPPTPPRRSVKRDAPDSDEGADEGTRRVRFRFGDGSDEQAAGDHGDGGAVVVGNGGDNDDFTDGEL